MHLEKLSKLVSDTFLADMEAMPVFYNRTKLFSLQIGKPDRPFTREFSPAVSERFEWQVVAMTITVRELNGKKHRTLTGYARVTGQQLQQAFSSSGFGGSFIFSAEEERKEVHGITRPVFDPLTAKLQFQISIWPDEAVHDFQKLDDEVDEFLTMVHLKTPSN